MRICLVTSSYPRFEQDGNARFVRSIAEAQAHQGHEVHVLAPYHPTVRPYNSPVQLHWFRYVLPTQWGVMGHAMALESDRRLGIAALWQAPLFAVVLAMSMQRIIHRWKIDLVHAHWAIPSGVLAGLVVSYSHTPLFISLHGSDMYVAQGNPPLGRMAGWALCRARGITASSPDFAESAIRLGASRDRIQVIPYGADTTKFDPACPRAELRQRLELMPDNLLILAAGRLVGKKGFDLLVRAMPAVLAAVPTARLIILGEGAERRTLERLKGELDLNGKVSLPGNVAWSEMPAYLAAADVFVMPSVRDVMGNIDGLPNVVLEAMAAGRAVVATRIAGIPLVVENNKTGILLDDAEPGEISRALIHLLKSSEERSAMGNAGRERVQNELNWMSWVNRVEQMYRA